MDLSKLIYAFSSTFVVVHITIHTNELIWASLELYRGCLCSHGCDESMFLLFCRSRCYEIWMNV